VIDQETQRLASILDAMAASAYIISDDYTVEFMNKTAISTFGQGVGKKCYDVIADGDEICPWCRAKEVFEGETLRWEHSFVHLNKTFEVYELPLKHPDGSVSHMCIYRDITERKAREKRLTASIEDYRRLFERIGCGVYISSREGRFLDANEALLDMLHYKRKEDLLQIDIAEDLYPTPEDRRKYQEIIEREGYVSDYEVDLKRRDGGFVSALINSRVRYDDQGNVVGYEGIIVDQTQRKEMELKLKKAHDFQTNLIQSSIDGIVAADRKGYLMIYNDGAQSIYGYTRQEALTGMHVTQLYFDGDARRVKALIYAPEFGGEGRLVNYELQVRDKEGRKVPIMLSAALLRENGREIGTVGFFKDMRQVKQLESELIKRFAFEHNLIQSSIDAIAASDADGNIIVFNRSAEELLGYSDAEVKSGKHRFRDFFPEEAMFEELKTAMRSETHSGQDRLFLYETTLKNKAGERIPVQLSATAMYEDGRQIGIVSFFRDLREIRRLEQQFADQARLLHEHKMISLGRLSASVVHELNNPLAGILNYLRLMLKVLNRGAPNAESLKKFKRYLSLAESETSRCSKIVSNLLAFSRKSDLEISAVNVIELLEKCVLLSQHKLMLSNIEIHTEFGPDTPTVWGDANQIQQALINLIFNAIDAMPEGGEIRLGCRPLTDKGLVEITVADTGRGIADKDLQQIFDPFYSTKTEGKGLGLGLSVVYGIIDRHKGKIYVNSQINKGTMFTIWLPAAEGAVQSKSA
jgi:PAS domain S-box-containing protein